MSNLQNIKVFESQVEKLDEEIDTVLAQPDRTTYLIDNYSKDEIHLMQRLLRQRKDIDQKTLGHLDALFQLAQSIRGTL